MSALSIALDIIGRDLTGGAFGSVMSKVGALDALNGSAGGAAASTAVLEGALIGAAAAGALFILGLKDAIDAGAQLEMASTMAGIAISDGTQHVQELSDAIVNLANTSQYKIADVDAAFRILGGLGFTTSQIISELGPEAITLGQALGGQATDGAQLLGQAFYLFNNQGMSASKMADILTNAFYNNMMSVSGLTQYIGMAGGTADALGVSFQQLMTFGSMLTPMFGSASSAGASLAYMMRNLAHPATSKMADEIKHLGLEIYDSQGNFVGLQSIMDQLFTKMQGMTQEQKMDVIGTLFNVRSGRAAMDLMSMTKDQFDATYSRIFDRLGQVGTAQKDATAINDTATGSWNRLTTTLNDFFAKSGEGINTYLKPFYNWMNQILSAAQKNQTIVEFFSAFLVAGVVLAVVVVLAAAIAMFGPIIAGVAIGFAIVAAGAAEVAAIFTILTTKGNLFSGALSFLNPIVNAVRATFQQLWSEITKNSAAWESLWNTLKPVLIVLGAVIGLMLVGPVVAFCLAILGIVDAAGQFLSWIQKMWGYLKIFGQVVLDVGTLLRDVFSGNWAAVAKDALQIQKDWNAASKTLSEQMTADMKKDADQRALDAQEAALKQKKGVLDAAAQQADQSAALAKQEYESDIKLANESKDAVTKAKYEQEAQVNLASYNQYVQDAANARAESQAVTQQMTTLKNNANATAQQTAQGVLDHMNNMSGGSISASHRMRQTVSADLITMKNDGIDAAVQMNQGVTGQLSALQRSTGQWGLDAAQNFANGLLAGQGNVDGAVNQLVLRVASKMQHSVPKEGPLAHDDEWGGHLVENFANGMLGKLGLVDHAGNALASTVARTITSPSIAASAVSANGGGAGRGVGVGQTIVIPVYVGSKQVAEVVYDTLKGTLQQNGMSRSLR